jgi:hypothetical protein
MTLQPKFVLKFDPSEIDALAERYCPAQDNDALNAGRLIDTVNYSKKPLKVIVDWKSPRRAALIDENQDGEITAVLELAGKSSTSEAMAVGLLTTLRGVGIPMASAILTAIHPEKYTVLDYRALESLGVNNWPDTVGFYVHYLEACRELAVRYGKSLRDFDRALWQWSKEQSHVKTRKHD